MQMKDFTNRLDDRKRRKLGELLRFGIVGVLATLLQYAEELAAALCGTRHLGRSRTAQYGLVKITATSFEQLKSDAVVAITAIVLVVIIVNSLVGVG